MNEEITDIEINEPILQSEADSPIDEPVAENNSAEPTSDNEMESEESSEEISKEIEAETVEQLKETISALKEQIASLEASRVAQEKMLEQMADFAALFPAVDLDCIPESVWESAKNGTPLAAAYALYEKRMSAEKARIEKINSINSHRSAGVAGKNTAAEFFTPDDVRKMSRAEVHANFSKIKRSMEKWN